MTLQISAQLEDRLRRAAQDRGMPADKMAEEILGSGLPQSSHAGSLSRLFAEWRAEESTDDPAELARRNDEFNEFQQAMNRNRLESEGSNTRTPFP